MGCKLAAFLINYFWYFLPAGFLGCFCGGVSNPAPPTSTLYLRIKSNSLYQLVQLLGAILRGICRWVDFCVFFVVDFAGVFLLLGGFLQFLEKFYAHF